MIAFHSTANLPFVLKTSKKLSNLKKKKKRVLIPKM